MRRGSNVIDHVPPAVDGGGDGGGWAWLVTARGHAEAHLVRGLLEGNGVAPIFMDASDPSPGSWMFLAGNINALVRIYVPLSQLEEARLTLLEAGVTAPDETPEAPSPASRAPWGTRLAWIAITLLIAALYLVAAFRNTLF